MFLTMAHVGYKLYRYTVIAMQLAMQQMENHEDGATVGHFSIKVSSHPKGMV